MKCNISQDILESNGRAFSSGYYCKTFIAQRVSEILLCIVFFQDEESAVDGLVHSSMSFSLFLCRFSLLLVACIVKDLNWQIFD